MLFPPDLPILTLYVACRVDVPPRTAVAAFDAFRAEEGSVPAGGVELVLGEPVPHHAAVAHRRHVHGRLRRAGRRVGIRVEVALEPWSASTAELGIRPRGRRVSLDETRRHRWYVAAAADTIEAFAVLLEQRVLVEQEAAVGLVEPLPVHLPFG